MNKGPNTEFPGGSRSRVNRAGQNVRDGVASLDDLAVIDEWRAAHRAVLNTFQAILRTRTREADVVVAQRHKRRSTIFDKLLRLPRMELGRMDDVAGCRLIFESVNELEAFRTTFHGARFNHSRKNHEDKYNYIKSPKATGYRGIHDVYSYDVKSTAGKRYKGLLVEVQYRTRIQHAWATAVEVIGFVTESQPKFQQGDKRYEHAMALAAEILARKFEDKKGPFPDLTNRDLVEQFVAADKELGLLRMLKGLNATEATQSENRNTILLFHHLESLSLDHIAMLLTHCERCLSLR